MGSSKSNKKAVVKKSVVKKSVKREVVNVTVKGKTGLGGTSAKQVVSTTIPATDEISVLNGGRLPGTFDHQLEVNKYDNINPNHYKNASIETIDMMIRIWGNDATALHCEMTAFKYRSRIGTKPGQSIKDELSKIEWYENKALELRGLPLKTLIKA
jgi:hypothetical protein